MDPKHILSKFEFYRKAPHALQVDIEAACRQVQLEAGATFFHQGDACPLVAFIGSGRIHVLRIDPRGREIALYHVEGGQACLINMLCAFLNTPCPGEAVTETPVDTLVVPSATFRHWVRTHDTMRTYVFEAMATRVIDLMTLVEEVAFQKMDKRLADLLSKHFVTNGTRRRDLAITHDEIAAELGTAREVVSRLLKDFERRGAIATARGHIELRSPAVLQLLIEGEP